MNLPASAVASAPHACWVAKSSSPGGYITGDCATGADQRGVANRDARQDDRPAPDPDVAPNADWTAEFKARGPRRRVPWVVGRKDLYPRVDLRAVADRDLHDIEDHAVEV